MSGRAIYIEMDSDDLGRCPLSWSPPRDQLRHYAIESKLSFSF
jgi:hypothetical protein